jgi:hypothetical protein
MEWFQNYWWMLLIGVLFLPIAAVALFARWLGTLAGLGFDEKLKSWDVFIKLVSALTVVGTGAVLIGKYFDQREQLAHREEQRATQESNLRTAEFLRQKLAFDTERHERRRRLFAEAKVVATRLATSKSAIAADVRRFEELYGADLIGVEQPGGPVEKAMVWFRRKFRGEPGARPDPIDQLALQLGEACEDELRTSEAALLAQHKEITALVSAGLSK